MQNLDRRSLVLAGATLGAGALLPRAAALTNARRGVRPGDFAYGVHPAIEGAQAFFEAVRRGDLEEVRRLLAERPELLGAGDEAGRSAVVCAFLAGRAEVAGLLLERGFEPDLVEAAMIPDWKRVEHLARARPELLDAAHPVGGTALYAAARMGREGLWRLQSLGANSDANPRGDAGVTPAYGALECPGAVDALFAAVDLLSNGAHANAAQRGGDSLLHAGARRGDPALVRYLLRRGADAAARDAQGRTPLEVARALGQAAAVGLLEHPEEVPRDDTSARWRYDASGGEVEWPDLSGVSLDTRHTVTVPSHFDLARVRAAVDPDPRLAFAKSSQDELGVEAASHTGRREIALYHLDHGVPMSLCTAISVGDLGRARALLAEDRRRVHERGPHDFALLWYVSIGGGSVEAAELLLEFGADLEQESRGSTVLHSAAERGQRDLAAFLLEAGADPSPVGYSEERVGETPLQIAQRSGHAALVALLKEHGAV